MGFDAVILVDEQHPTWDFKSGYVDWLDRWKQPHNLKTWFDNSCVWYSQVITKTLGAKFSNYLHRLAYGNKDVSGIIMRIMGLRILGYQVHLRLL